MVEYACKECDSLVLLIEGELHRTCDHEDAPIVAWISAVATGESRVN